MARLENLLAAGTSHLEVEYFEFLNCLIQIAGPARTGALGLARALVDPHRVSSGGWVLVGTSQLVHYARGDKEAVTTAMRRFELVGLAEEIQFPCLAEHLQREWRIRCRWQHPDAWVVAVERVLAEFPRDGRKNRRRNKQDQDSSSIPADSFGVKDTCGISASLLQGTTLFSSPSSIHESREEEGRESLDSSLDHERVLLAEALCPTYVQSVEWAQKVVLGAKSPQKIQEMLPALSSEARSNARDGKDGAGLLLHWIATGQADARVERLSRLQNFAVPAMPQARRLALPCPSPDHDPAALAIWRPVLAEVIPGLIPAESIQTWLAPLTAEAWDGEILELRADSEAAYFWITQQLEEEWKSIGTAIKILPPKASHHLHLAD
jgi:hypothetical protein